MAGMSLYLAQALLNEVLNDTPWTPPTSVWLALYTSDPTDMNTGTEVSGGSYARFDATGLFTPLSGHNAPSNAAVTFTGLPGCTLTHGALLDASSAGNLLFYGALLNPRTVLTGGTYELPVGTVVPEMN